MPVSLPSFAYAAVIYSAHIVKNHDKFKVTITWKEMIRAYNKVFFNIITEGGGGIIMFSISSVYMN